MSEKLIKQLAVILYGMLAAVWTGVLISNIVFFYVGRTPSWTTVFIALFSCTLNKWIDFRVSQKIEEGYFDDEM